MVAVLAQFVDSVPHALTDALVNLAPFIGAIARVSRLICWTSDWHASWIALAVWWACCLATPALFRYAFPLVTAAAFIWYTRHRTPPAVTELTLQNTIADLTSLRDALPAVPCPTPPPIATLRAAAILTVPWLILSYVISARLLLALIGTIVLTHKAPWARVLRSVLWRSAFVRISLYRLRAFLTGQPLPAYVVSNQPTQTTPAPVPSLRFLFTVYENQRWWMGLDWTAALLPTERPSWCTPSFHPVSPPNAFTLPDSTTIYLPTPDGKSRIKRTAIWKWEEPEWRLLIHKEGSSVSRIERAPPSPDDPNLTSALSATASGSRLFKAAANKFKESAATSPTRSSFPTHPESENASTNNNSDQDNDQEPFTDPDGWIYGDNKWENQSSRGGLSKYTRYRRWTRIAAVHEVVEVVGPGETGIQNTNDTPFANLKRPSTPIKSEAEPTPQTPDLPMPPATASIVNHEESPLRQRLRAALKKPSS